MFGTRLKNDAIYKRLIPVYSFIICDQAMYTGTITACILANYGQDLVHILYSTTLVYLNCRRPHRVTKHMNALRKLTDTVGARSTHSPVGLRCALVAPGVKAADRHPVICTSTRWCVLNVVLCFGTGSTKPSGRVFTVVTSMSDVGSWFSPGTCSRERTYSV